MTTTHPSGLPEQEPTSPTAVVLHDGVTWVRTGKTRWDSQSYMFRDWKELRTFVAKLGGAVLYDLADLPTGLTGLTEVQKEVVRTAQAALTACGAEGSSRILCEAFPDVLADDLATATWESGNSDEKRNELVRVAKMEGAHVTATRYGATRSGNVHHVERSVRIHLGIISEEVVIDLPLGGWTITVTAPKPTELGADIPDEVVDAALAAIPWASVHQRADLRAALAAADAKRAELAGGVA